MPEPSLGELASAGQSIEAVPTIAVNNQQDMVRNLNQQAQFKAQNDWNKYLNFQKNLGDFYQNADEVAKLDVMDEDREALQKDTAEVLKKALENPDAFSGRNPAIYGELRSMASGLMSKATESKQNNLFDKSNRQFLAQNNDLNNDDNKAVVEQFRAQPLGSRKAYTLSVTPVFDANAFSEGLKSKLTKTEKVPSLIGGLDEKGNAIPGDKYMRETTTETVPYQQFKTQWNNAYGFQDDKNGQPIKKWADKQYESLPEDIKKKVSKEQFWDKVGDNFYGSTKDEKGNIKDIIKKTEGEIKANPNYLGEEKLKVSKDELSERTRHNKAMEGLGWQKIKSGNAEDDEEAQGVITEISDVIENATRPENLKFVVDAKGNRQQMGTMSDPELIKKYTTLDKEGKTTNPPDDALIDRTSGQAMIVYYKRNEDGEIEKSPQGANIIAKSIPVNTSTWVSSVVGRNESTKNKGKVNNTVQKFYDKLGGVYQGSRKLNQAKAKQDEGGSKEVQVTKTVVDYSPEIQTGIKSFMKANKLTEEQAIKILRENKKID